MSSFCLQLNGAPKVHTGLSLSCRNQNSELSTVLGEEVQKGNYPQQFFPKPGTEFPGLLEVYFADLNLTQFLLFPQDSQVHLFSIFDN